MKWIIGYSQGEAQGLDTAILANSRARLGTVATKWGVFKHPDRDEWCVPWDEERAAIAVLVTNQVAFLEARRNENRVKDFSEIKLDRWREELEGSEPV